jgi:hypothetical protein
MNRRGEGVGGIGGMKELVEKHKNGAFMAQGGRRKFNLSFKTGFGSGEIVGLEADTEGLEGRGGQMTDGTSKGVGQEGGEREGAEHGGLSSLVRASQERMAFVAFQSERERHAVFWRQMEIIGIAEIKDGLALDPLDGVDVVEVIELEMDLELPEIRQGQLTIGRMKKCLRGSVGGGEVVGERTRMVGVTVLFQAFVQDLITRLQLDPLASIGLHGLVNGV